MRKVVLSEPYEYQALLLRLGTLEGLSVYCDNPRFETFLRERGVPYTLLDEFLIPEDEGRALNAWACDRAAHWLRLTKEKKIFKDFDLASVIFLRLGYFLVQVLKNDWYARQLLASDPPAVIIFDFKNLPNYPNFSGHAVLNDALKKHCGDRGIPVETVEIQNPFSPNRDELLRGLMSPQDRFKRHLKSFLRKIISASVFRGGNPAVKVMASGHLKYLSPIILELRRRNVSVGLADSDFRWKHFWFARQNGCVYQVFGNTGAGFSRDLGPHLREQLSKQLGEAVREASVQNIFCHETMNAAPLLEKHIFSRMNDYISSLADEAADFSQLLTSQPFSTLLLDDDTSSSKAFLAAFARKRGVRVFTLSHAVFHPNFSVSPENRVFANSETFVSSDREKEVYERRGWDSSRLIVSGIPRLEKVPESRLKTSSKKIKHVFYCGASMKLYWPGRGTYIGLHVTNYGSYQRKVFRMLFNAAKNLPVNLSAKPHNFEGDAWKRVLKEEGMEPKVRLIPHQADFIQHLASCDVMVLGHWSTAITEAAHLGIPVILVDLYHSKPLMPYDQVMWFRVVRSLEELKQALKEALNQNVFQKKSPARLDLWAHFFGNCDGQSAARIADQLVAGFAK